MNAQVPAENAAMRHRAQVPLDQVSADDVRRVLRRIVRKEPVPVAKFGSAI